MCEVNILTPRNVWYHAKFCHISVYMNCETGLIIAKNSITDIFISFLFSIDELLDRLFGLYLFTEEDFKATIVNKEITDKDWNEIQKVLEIMKETV